MRDAGGEPVLLNMPSTIPMGVAVAREWAADAAQISYARADLDAVLATAAEPAELVGLLVAALRLDLPVVAAPDVRTCAALSALGLAPTSAKPSEVVVGIGGDGGPRPTRLVEDFALANALRAHLSLGGGPEMLVHLAALAREAGDIGFSQMVRVLTPETPTLVDRSSGWFDEYGVAGLLATMGRALHDIETVSGRLHEELPDAPPDPPSPGDSRLVFVRGRTSGTEALLRVGEPVSDVAGECRCYASEEDAVRGYRRRKGRAGLFAGGRGVRAEGRTWPPAPGRARRRPGGARAGRERLCRHRWVATGRTRVEPGYRCSIPKPPRAV